MKHKNTFLLLVPFVLLLCSCASGLNGTFFKAVSDTPKDKGIVYVFWPNPNNNGSRIDFELFANGKSMTDMKKGGYYVFPAEPGELDLETSPNFTFGQMGLLDIAMTFNEHLKLSIEPRKTYFVRCYLAGWRGSYQLQMKLLSETEGVNEIQATRLLPPRE